jgi:hypothetical protein
MNVAKSVAMNAAILACPALRGQQSGSLVPQMARKRAMPNGKSKQQV